MQFTSMRAFYLKNATPDSCNYSAFARKMNKLKRDIGDKSGISQVNPTFILIDSKYTHLYFPLLSKRCRK